MAQPTPAHTSLHDQDPDAWWRTAAVYQVYIRSFADGDGDGIGDIAGLRARLPYLAELGVDALWINPWYPSPQADAGYDVADYRGIEPTYGTLAEAEALIDEAHAANLRVILDIVPNHTSSAHRWFQTALAGDQAARARYIFRPGRGERGEFPPNDWHSQFGGPAWTRVSDSYGTPGEWYLHLFAPDQPDLNWENGEVRDEFEDVLRFWFDRGVDGFRIDVAHGLSKTPGLPDAGLRDRGALDTAAHPAWDHDDVHEIYRSWRKIADSYAPPRIFVAESWVPTSERLARYLRPDELHLAFQFDFLQAPFRADHLRAIADEAMNAVADVSAPSTWVLSNHDVVRHVTRYARTQPDHLVDRVWEQQRWATETPDLELGVRRARAALMMVLALPGSAYLYQGEELGLPEVEHIPSDRRQDPVFEQSGRALPGRDGCRVPLPWVGSAPSYGFSAADAAAEPWLPQPGDWGPLTVAAQDQDPASTLGLYRECLRLRRQVLLSKPFAWVDSPKETLAFRRGDVECWLNSGAEVVRLPAGNVLLRSTPEGEDGVLPPNSAAWVMTVVP
ncbi:glycoside hydrolase family 13 protein [Nocardioides pocheonensis]|uniref:glycoside hydrolase family 13 protein n=1 Tax=Nocardioides pocheonensis TaxID=661485 RepID=UPI00161595C4|nr:glycoside hydrolase family 13 protein [Nocardioides pocheonensis]